MFSYLSSCLSSVVGGASRQTPSTWDPSTPLADGHFVSKQLLRVPISAESAVAFVGRTGAWTHGTLEFDCTEESSPPSYDLSVGLTTAQDQKHQVGGRQLGNGQTFLEVQVEARWTDEELWKESHVSLTSSPDTRQVELTISTPMMSPSRLMSQLSFHVSFRFPSSIESYTSLATSGSLWRTIGLPGLAATKWHEVNIHTVNENIDFNSLLADKVTIETINGSISGSYEVGTGGATFGTKNGKITLKSCTSLGPCQATNANAPISGLFTVSEGLRLISCNGRIDAKILSRSSKSKDGVMSTTPTTSTEGQKSKTVTLFIETENAAINLDVETESDSFVTSLEAINANGGISVQRQGPFDGPIDLSTVNGKAHLDFPPSHIFQPTKESSANIVGQLNSDGLAKANSSIATFHTINGAVSLVVYKHLKKYILDS